LEDIPTEEAEYFAQLPYDCILPSVYPGDGNVSCTYGAAQPAEAGYAVSGWVASARQLLKIVRVFGPPHCSKDECILNKSWRNEIEKRPPYVPIDSTAWQGLGWFIRAGADDDLGWQHDGSDPGTGAFVIRMNEKNGYAYAAIFNGNNSTGLQDEVGADAAAFDLRAKCIADDEWQTLDGSAAESSALVSRVV